MLPLGIDGNAVRFRPPAQGDGAEHLEITRANSRETTRVLVRYPNASVTGECKAPRICANANFGKLGVGHDVEDTNCGIVWIDVPDAIVVSALFIEDALRNGWAFCRELRIDILHKASANFDARVIRCREGDGISMEMSLIQQH